MKFVIISQVILLSFLMSCGVDNLVDDCFSIVEINQAIGVETQNLTSALTNFNAEQSDNNCDDVVAAYRSYINALEDFQGCANLAGVGSEFSQSLSEAQDELGDFDCN